MKTAILLPRDSFEYQLADGDEEPVRRIDPPVWCTGCGRATVRGSCTDDTCSGHTHDECECCGERVAPGALRSRGGSWQCAECHEFCLCCGERVGAQNLTRSPVSGQDVCGACRTDEERDARDRGVTVADLAAEWARL